jgi:type II secretory ATPase GspE/PulE/Tfp pilus assembly ATPase PilB-like protein
MARYTINTDKHLPPEQRRIVARVSPKYKPPKIVEDEEEYDIEDGYEEVPEEEVPEIHQDALLFARGVLSEAILQGASDVHFEPKNKTFQIRYRIDGALHQIQEHPIEEYETVLNALKVLADMNIAEHAIPQDGHIELVQEEIERHIQNTQRVDPKHPSLHHGKKVKERQRFFDIRVSIFPSVNGEVVVMRILNRDTALLTIEQLGMDTDSLQRLHEVLLTSYGMILVTGPTGSGKTTTLYSVMSELRNDEKNIITLEDPIEFHLDWLRQCEMREDRGFTFETALASVLRQDPDILMIGEIRDPRTAEYAVRSALVGRIIGSTIHANTAIGTIARLLELGIPRSTIAHTINGIIAQRLVRRTCDSCKIEYTPSIEHLKHFGLENVSTPFYKGDGCDACGNIGYKGRMGIFSLMVFDDDIRNQLFEQKPLLDIQNYAIKKGMRTLKMDAAAKILGGLTTVEEALRVI